MGSQDMKDFKITGIVAAPFTPFSDDGELALDKIDAYIDHLLATGVQSVYICGTTGEGPSLTIEERKKVAGKWVKAANGRFKAVIVQVGSGNLKEVEELARHAVSIGADAISTIPTIFFKPANPGVIAEFLQRVSNAAPTIPLYYYHNPTMSGVNFSMESIMKLCGGIKTLRGAKFTSASLYDLSRCICTCSDNFQFLYAVDEQLLPSLTLGIKGCVGSTYNYLGNVANRLIKAYDNGKMDLARKEQFVNIVGKYGGNVAINKVVANLSGLDLGPSRHPLVQPTENTIKQIKSDLENVGFFEFIK
ncbi:N-acetylneuraminate lyase-like [Anneissia japonica]|uniref:N-acetylneuraminate lyase-like n=1 Tax=Anneissia japonica TaxID=1529436 RepID=UPI0014255ED6|nr:N-acetylneuraminate lyase-like [Anneissia japonica]